MSLQSLAACDVDAGAIERFRLSLVRYAELVRGEGLVVRPFQSAALPVFRDLSPDARRYALATAERTVDVLEETRAAGASLRDTPQLLWRVFGRLGLAPPSALFDKIQGTDVVEVVSPTHRHLFWNLRAMELVSFSLEQLFCIPWNELLRRDPSVERSCFEMCSDLLSGRITAPVRPEVEPHIVTEIGTETPRSLKVEFRWVAPVRGQGQVAALVVVHHCELLSKLSH